MLFRRSCPGCRRPLGRVIVCGPCTAEIDALEPIRLVDQLDGLDFVAALHRYEPPVPALVLAAKNGGRRSLLRWWGSQLARLAEPGVQPGAPSRDRAITWVPASRLGVRQRGYDQGRLLANSMAASLGLASRRLLIRRPGPSRAGSGRIDRLDAPDLRCPIRSPRSVILVDDVLTTGVSLSAAATALRSAGAEQVVGLVLAVAGENPSIRAFDPDDRRAPQH